MVLAKTKVLQILNRFKNFEFEKHQAVVCGNLREDFRFLKIIS